MPPRHHWSKVCELMHLPGVQTIDEVKASGRYRFLTPDQLIAEILRDFEQRGDALRHLPRSSTRSDSKPQSK